MNKVVYLIIALCLFSCSDMDENYREHVPEFNYSGKIKNLRGYVGFERVYLAWENPLDQKSKYIRIEYDSTFIEYDSLIDSVVIENLNSGSGYEFFIFTVDDYGNKSVASSKTILPVSKTFVNSIPKPNIKVIENKDGNVVFDIKGLTNSLMKFTGLINYQCESSSGSVIAGSQEYQENEGDVILSINGLEVNENYTVKLDLMIIPIVSNNLTMDVVPKSVSLELQTN